MSLFTASVYFLWNLFYLLVIWPVRVIFAFFGWLLSLVSYFPVIFVLAAIGFLMIPWVSYHDRIIENVEFAMRCRVGPVWQEFLSPIFRLFQILWNPLICWWNALNWFSYGWIEVVAIPIAIDGNVIDTITNLAKFLNILIRDLLIGYFLTGDFLTEEISLTTCVGVGCVSMCDAWIAFWKTWQNLVGEFCRDLQKFWSQQGILNIPIFGLPPLNPLALLGSEQLADPQFWCALENFFNAGMTPLHIAFRFLILLITPGSFPLSSDERPDGRIFWQRLCDGFTCLIRSMENLAQIYVDCYLPWDIQISARPGMFPLEPEREAGMFCILDSLFCILALSVDTILRLLIHIDEVASYPTNPFYEQVIKKDLIAIANLWAEPSEFPAIIISPSMFIPNGFYISDNRLSVSDPSSPIFGLHRMDNCICILISRIICDPTDPRSE